MWYNSQLGIILSYDCYNNIIVIFDSCGISYNITLFIDIIISVFILLPDPSKLFARGEFL